MYKLCLFLAVLFASAAHTQQFVVSPSTFGNEKGQVLNETDYLPIKKSSGFTITPDIQYGKKGKRFAKWLIRTAVTSVATYKITHMQSGNLKQGSNEQSKSAQSSLGFGLMTGLSNIIPVTKSKQNAFIIYSLYSRQKQLIERKVIPWKAKKSKKIQGTALEDGFLKVSFINGSKSIKRLGDMLVNIETARVETSLPLNNSNGGGSGGGTTDPEETAVLIIEINGIEISFYDKDNDGIIDGYSYSDEWGVYVGNVSEGGNYDISNIEDVMEGYDPSEWNSPEDYLDAYEEINNNTNQNSDDPCSPTAQTSGSSATSTYANIKSTVNQFNPITSTSTGQHEQYFLVNGNSPTPIQTLGENGGLPQGINSTTTVMAHTHPAGAGDPSPSLPDLFALEDIGSQFQASYVVAYDGTKYAMIVNDYAQLQAFIDANSDLYDPITGSINTQNSWGWAYASAVVTFTEQGMSSIEANERARAYIMQLAGVTLVKAPPGSDVFTKIGATPQTDTNGNVIVDQDGIIHFKISDCPR